MGPVAEVETVPLNAARGRVVAHDIVAPIDLPPFDNSAVDGYAVRHADLAPEDDTRLTIVERVTAGRAAARAVAAGEAVRIFTGAPMPAGADTVFMQEDCRIDGEAVVPRDDGTPDFRTLRSRGHEAVLYAFDLIEHDGVDLCELPLIERKRQLARLIGRGKRNAIRFVEHLTDDGPTVFDHACRMGLEGIVSKRTDAPYRSGPSRT